MTIHIVDPDVWAAIRKAIAEERSSRLEGLLQCRPEGLPREQGFIEALDWVVKLSDPAPPQPEDEIYEC